MHFDFCIGNPPYQSDKNNERLYPYFYNGGLSIADCVEMIFPNNWRGVIRMNGLSVLNNETIKRDSQIVFIKDEHNVFNGISGAEWTNIVVWKKGYDNGLNGSQRIIDCHGNVSIELLPIDLKDVKKPLLLKRLSDIVLDSGNFQSLSSMFSVLRPYGLRTDVIYNTAKYGLQPLQDKRLKDSDIKVYAKRVIKYVPAEYKFPKIRNLFQFKVFVPYAWGAMDEKKYYGGTFSDIIIGYPSECCTETYLESGGFDTKFFAVCHAKYLLTKFARALLYLNKYTRVNSSSAWASVPVQDYHEDFWNGTIAEIDVALMDKYNVPNNIRQFVFANIQTKTEDNIVNFNGI